MSEEETAQDDGIGLTSFVELEMFQRAISNYKIHGHFLKDDAVSLEWIFGPLIDEVLDLVDEECVTVMKSSSSDKVLVQVHGMEGAEVYWVPGGGCACQCSFYMSEPDVCCQHILASAITLALDTPDEYEEMAESEMTKIYNKIIKKKYLERQEEMRSKIEID